MNTLIAIQSQGGDLTAKPDTVNLSKGDTVTFKASADVLLCFADETADVLVPNPSEPAALTSGSSLTYTFAEAGVGAYTISVVPAGSEAPAVDFGGGDTGPYLKILVPSGRPTPAQDNDGN